MRPPRVLDSPARLYWLSAVVSGASIVLSVLISGVYANATVWAGDARGGADCGTVWEPNAVTSACATALKERAWAATALQGIALFAALGSVVVAGRPLRGFGRQVAALAAIVVAVVIIAGLIWAGVIDRTVGV
jgi:hypothetical protein